MITAVNTRAEFEALPFYLKEALKTSEVRSHRYLNNIEKATRKTTIQIAVVRAIKEEIISFDFGKEILITNNAYGPNGKKALKECEK